jgi:hypothetical protein
VAAQGQEAGQEEVEGADVPLHAAVHPMNCRPSPIFLVHRFIRQRSFEVKRFILFYFVPVKKKYFLLFASSLFPLKKVTRRLEVNTYIHVSITYENPTSFKSPDPGANLQQNIRSTTTDQMPALQTWFCPWV